MGKSSGIPYFVGERIAHTGYISDMVASVQPIMKVYPRTIGGVLKAGGITNKVITVENSIIGDGTQTRGDFEEYMHEFNEKFGPQKGTLRIDDNSYPNCSINTIKYSPNINKNFITQTIDFSLGEQSETTDIAQLVPGTLYEDTRGRPGLFVATIGKGVDAVRREFKLWHNMDITRDLENRLTMELHDVNSTDNTIKFNGGFETITGYCWMKAAEEDQEIGWRQTVGAYIYNIMNGPLGNFGTLYLGGKTINNCLFTSVKLQSVHPTSARYEVTLHVSLEC